MASHTGDDCDMAVILLNHGREELFRGEKVRECIHIQSSSNQRLGFIEDSPVVKNTSIVDQDCRLAVFFSDYICCILDAFCDGDVCFDKVGV